MDVSVTYPRNPNVECALYFIAKDGDMKALYIWKAASGRHLALWNSTKNINEWEI